MRQRLTPTNTFRNLADETLVPYLKEPGNTAREGSFDGATSLDELITLFLQDCPVLVTRLADEMTAVDLPSVSRPVPPFSGSRGASRMFLSRDVTGNSNLAEVAQDDVRAGGVIDTLMALVEAVQRGDGRRAAESRHDRATA